MSRSLFAVALASVVAGCPGPVRSGRVVEAASEPPRVLHVDRRAIAEGGDGTRERPFRSLGEAIERAGMRGPVRIEARSGLYESTVRLRPGLTIAGHGGPVILHAPAAVVIDAWGGALEDVIVQGGEVGVLVSGEVVLRRVELSGQRRIGIRVESGRLTAEELKATAVVSELTGVSVESGASAEVRGGVLRGPHRSGIEVTGGTLVADRLSFEDAVTAVKLRAGDATIRRSRARGGRGPAFALARGRMLLEAVDVFGHEYGVLAGEAAQLEVKELVSIRAERAGVALSQARGTLENVTVIEAGTFGGVQLVNSETHLKGLRVHRAMAAGVMVRGGKTTLSEAAITSTLASDPTSGDGILVRFGEASISSILIAESAGAGMIVGNGARVRLRDAVIDGAGQGGLVADYQAQLAAESVVVRRTPEAAFVAIEGAALTVDVATVEEAVNALAWAECGAGASIVLTRVRSSAPHASSPCVTVVR